MAADLSTVLGTLSPREKDARVAEALGLVRPKQAGCSLRRYSSEWHGAGPLLDRLREYGWTAEARCGTYSVSLLEAKPGANAIALAFCLAQEADNA